MIAILIISIATLVFATFIVEALNLHDKMRYNELMFKIELERTRRILNQPRNKE
jgi:hypothetical protein